MSRRANTIKLQIPKHLYKPLQYALGLGGLALAGSLVVRATRTDPDDSDDSDGSGLEESTWEEFTSAASPFAVAATSGSITILDDPTTLLRLQRQTLQAQRQTLQARRDNLGIDLRIAHLPAVEGQSDTFVAERKAGIPKLEAELEGIDLKLKKIDAQLEALNKKLNDVIE